MQELYKVETARDDYRAKVELQDRELQDLRMRTDELQRKAEEAQHLKDEVDILRETADRVGQYEATIASYKKKLDEASDMKRQLKLLEDKNLELVQQNLQLEDDVKKSGTWRPQLEQYKKQVAELHSQLAEVSITNKNRLFGLLLGLFLLTNLTLDCRKLKERIVLHLRAERLQKN